MTIPWQVGGGKGYLERFRGDTVAGRRRERLPETLLQGNRARWTAGRCHLERFCGDTVAGGRQERLPGTILRGVRPRWAAGQATWNAFAGIPCQVGGEKGYLERFRGDSVAGGQQEVLPDTLLREFRGRWEAERCHLEHFRRDSVPGGR